MRWAVLMSAAVLAACGGDNDGTGPGTGGPAFTADVTGDVQTSIQGDALFGHIVDPEAGPAFAVEMSEDDPTGGALIQIIRLGPWTPAVGSYALTDAIKGTPGEGNWVGAAYDSENGQLVAIFAATSGTLKVTSVPAGRFKGSFTFEAKGGLLSDPEKEMTISVSGSFTASQGTSQAMRARPRAVPGPAVKQ
jgi:hypothetical protein